MTFAAFARVVATERSRCTRTVPAWASRVSSEPTPDEMTSTGIRVPGPKSVAERGAVRPGRPSFAISAAEAPPACAMPAFCENGQPPRRISAIAPCGKPLKSESAQPPEPPTGTTGAVTFPPPE